MVDIINIYDILMMVIKISQKYIIALYFPSLTMCIHIIILFITNTQDHRSDAYFYTHCISDKGEYKCIFVKNIES